jgi:CBS domain-containing protein
VRVIELNKRQEEILAIVKSEGPITGEHIADKLNLTRATLRPDLAILTMSGLLEARPRVGYFYAGKTTHSLLSDRLSKFRVSDLQSLPVVITEQKSAYDAVVTMFTEDVGTLSVVSMEGYLEGIISRKDLLKLALGGSELDKIPVGIVMTRMPNVVLTTLEEQVYLAAEKILHHQVDGLPVVQLVTGNNGEQRYKVIGRFTKTNITRLFAELVEENF